MSRASLERALPVGERLLLDASVLIAYLNGGEHVSPVAAEIIDAFVRSGRNQAVVAMVTVMELLERPLRRGAEEPYRHVLDFLTRFPGLRCVEIDLHVAQEAAALRATYNFASADALVAATGIVAQVGHLVTNDANWQERLRPIAQRVSVCYLTRHLPFP